MTIIKCVSLIIQLNHNYLMLSWVNIINYVLTQNQIKGVGSQITKSDLRFLLCKFSYFLCKFYGTWFVYCVSFYVFSLDSCLLQVHCCLLYDAPIKVLCYFAWCVNNNKCRHQYGSTWQGLLQLSYISRAFTAMSTAISIASLSGSPNRVKEWQNKMNVENFIGFI
jgi:hypothetical protein